MCTYLSLSIHRHTRFSRNKVPRGLISAQYPAVAAGRWSSQVTAVILLNGPVITQMFLMLLPAVMSFRCTSHRLSVKYGSQCYL